MRDAYDVLVLGGGIAGVAAALAASSRGRRVGLVRATPGATAMCAGGWRGRLPELLGAALAAAGHPLATTGRSLPHPSGHLEFYDLAPPWHAAAPLEEGTLVCGIDGLPGFHPGTLAELWGHDAGVELRASRVSAGPSTPSAGWSPVSLAAELDRSPAVLAEALAEAVRQAGATSLILPAVLGLEQPADVCQLLSDAAGVPVAEALGAPPSIPGWRLDRALLACLNAARVDVTIGRAAGGISDSASLERVTVTRADGSEMELAARQFVLATGKFAGCGIAASDALREAALGCPVFISGENLAALEPLPHTRLDRSAPQPLLEAGVRADADAHPVDREGCIVYENVRIAGVIRAGTAGWVLGLGSAAMDGLAAGAAAAEAV